MALQQELEEVKKYLLKEITGSITPEEKIKLQEWADATEEHQAFIEQILSEEFLTQAVLDRNERKQQEEWQKLYYKIGYVRPLTTSFRKWIAVAAMICLLLGSGFYLLNRETLIHSGCSKAFLQTV
ncbi:hypothetical protein, partial [Bacteroides acidifaciens]